MSTVVGTQLRQVSNYIDEHRRAISARASKSRSAESHKVELIRVMAQRSADCQETQASVNNTEEISKPQKQLTV